MLVRDLGEAFHLIFQPDHGDVSGQIAAAWSEPAGLSEATRRALIIAATRHDDGWAVWERHPRLDGEGRPQIFHDVPLGSLLSCYRACAEVVCEQNSAAGLLVSMHVSGLQRNRYGVMDPQRAVTPLEELEPAVREFVAGEERRQRELIAALGISEPERWRAYRLLQACDLFSLYLGLADLEYGGSPATAPTRIGSGGGRGRGGGGDPGGEGGGQGDGGLGDGGDVGPLELSSAGEPWSVVCEPFPFAASPTYVRMRRQLLRKRRWPDEDSFRTDLGAAFTEDVEISLVAAP